MNLSTPVSDPLVLEHLQTVVTQFEFKLINAYTCRKVWCLETTAGLKYLKKTKLDINDLNFIHQVLEYIHSRGFQTAPRYYLSSNQKPFVELECQRYILTDWYCSGELDFNKKSDLQDATRFLAQFHQQASGFEPVESIESNVPNKLGETGLTHYRTNWYEWPGKFESRIRQLHEFRRAAAADKDNSAFSRLYLRYFEPFYRQAQISLEQLLKSPYPCVASTAAATKSFCHHDYSARNILRTQSQQLILIDFDYCLRDIRLHDLINLLVRNLKHNEWSVELGAFIIKQYHQIAPLSSAELETLPVLLSWPQDFWQVGLQYYVEKLPWSSERFLKKLERKVMQRFDRDHFLKELPKLEFSLK